MSLRLSGSISSWHFLCAMICNIIQNHHWKWGQQSAIFWNSLGLFREYGLHYIYLGIKLFVFQDRKLKLSASVWKKIRETSQNFNSISSFRQLLFSFFLSVVWLSWNFVRFHNFFFKQMLKVSAFYLEKQKKVLFLK